MARLGHPADLRVVHPERTETNALPVNVARQDALPDDRGWWGYSMRDVPERVSGAALLATVPEARIVSYVDARNEFYPGILGHGARALDTREIKFRPPHAAALRTAQGSGERPLRLERATWVMERVYDNHSHWLTAHLPKLLMLREAGLLAEALMPRSLKPAMAESLALLGIEVEGLRHYDPERVLEVGALTIPVTDRFDPRLLRPVRAAMPKLGDASPHRRLYVSRARARFRRLENEDAIWPRLAARGFEKVFLEELSFRDQVRLMQEAHVVAAPHGAGLTNMMFCPEGTAIVEIASLGFPNPNFYALAAAMGHDYALVAAEERGEDRPQLERNLIVDPEALEAALDAVQATSGRPSDRSA
jgi:hypothetical protein